MAKVLCVRVRVRDAVERRAVVAVVLERAGGAEVAAAVTAIAKQQVVAARVLGRAGAEGLLAQSAREHLWALIRTALLLECLAVCKRRLAGCAQNLIAPETICDAFIAPYYVALTTRYFALPARDLVARDAKHVAPPRAVNRESPHAEMAQCGAAARAVCICTYGARTGAYGAAVITLAAPTRLLDALQAVVLAAPLALPKLPACSVVGRVTRGTIEEVGLCARGAEAFAACTHRLGRAHCANSLATKRTRRAV